MAESVKNGRETEFYSLYATDLPVELDENGIKKIFNKFGTVTSIIAPDDSKFAFISYATYAEAEAAIASLDNKPPLFLRVEFRRKKLRENENGLPIQNNVESPGSPSMPPGHDIDIRYNESRLPRLMGSRPGAVFKFPPPELSPYYYNYSKDRPIHPSAYDFYDDIDYPETNALWSRGKLTIDTAGRRHLSLGRGYAHYIIPEPYSGAANHVNRIHEQRNPGCYSSGQDELSDQVGKCLACAKNAVLCCGSCEGFYCSRECQKADWPKHKKECMAIPALMKATDAKLKVQTVETPVKSVVNNDNLKNINVVDSGETIRQSRFVIHDGSNEKQKKDDKPEKVDLAKRLQKIRKDSLSADDHAFEFRRDKDTFLSTMDFVEVQIVLIHKSGIMSVQKTVDIPKLLELMNNLDTSGPKLPKVQSAIPGKIYAAPYDQIWHRVMIGQKNSLLMLDYIDYGTLVPFVDTIDLREIGELADIPRLSRTICLPSQYMDKCKRLKENETMKIRMINIEDNGIINVEIFEEEKVEPTPLNVQFPRKKIISSEMMPKPLKASSQGNLMASLEKKIEEKLVSERAIESKQPPVQPKVQIPVQPKVQSPVQPTVQIPVQPKVRSPVQPKVQTPVPPPATPIETFPEKAPAPVSNLIEEQVQKKVESFPSILEVLNIGITPIIAELTYQIDERSVIAVLLFGEVQEAFQLLVEPLKENCDAHAPKYTDFKPAVNDLVCAYKSSDTYWRRARVLSTTPSLSVASLDEGQTIDADKVIPLSAMYSNVHSFSVVLSTENPFPIAVPATPTMKIVDKKATTCPNSDLIVYAELLEAPYAGVKVIITNWNPITEIAPVPTIQEVKPKRAVDIKNKSTVAVQTVRGTSILYVRSMEEHEVERYNRMIQDTAKASLIALDLKTMPSVNDFVLAKFLDDNFYRAIVLDVEGDKIRIAYVDFGNMEVTSLNKLKMMPTGLKQEPYCSTKVVLKDIATVPPTKKAAVYLGTIADQEIQFICTFDGSIDDGVTLTGMDGKVLNDIINELLTADWKKPEDEKPMEEEEYFKLRDMEMGQLGEIGKTVQACYLGLIEPGFKYVFAPMDKELIIHITHVLPPLLTEYCEKSEMYIPRVNELCIAKVSGEWCRGCCVKRSLTPTTAEIYFPDWGTIGEVPHEDIRMMQRDFLKPSALGAICNVLDLIPDDIKPSAELLKALEDLLIPQEAYTMQILKYEDAEWTIELPDVKRQLIQRV